MRMLDRRCARRASSATADRGRRRPGAPLARGRWGVDPTRASRGRCPGDDLVAGRRPRSRPAGSRSTRRPSAVWPWLVQMGFGRAGWYSYDQLDMRGTSADDDRAGVADARGRRHRPDAIRAAGSRSAVVEPGAGARPARRTPRSSRARRPRRASGRRPPSRSATARGGRRRQARARILGRRPRSEFAAQLGVRPRAARWRPDAARSSAFRVRFGDGEPRHRALVDAGPRASACS